MTGTFNDSITYYSHYGNTVFSNLYTKSFSDKTHTQRIIKKTGVFGMKEHINIPKEAKAPELTKQGPESANNQTAFQTDRALILIIHLKCETSFFAPR